MIACDVLRIGTVGLIAIPGMPFPALCAAVLHPAGRGPVLGRPGRAARCAARRHVRAGSAVGNISFQVSQILGFVAGAAVVALVDPYRTLG
jgi:hypothetical protein